MKFHNISLFICLVTLLVPSFGIASTSVSAPKDPSPVYFPSLPDSLLQQDFGERISLSRESAKSRRSGDDSNDLLPVLYPKLTTTTEKLPLAQESHVVNISITAAPDPAYLTDTVYYDSGPTPSPKQPKNGFPEIIRLSPEDKEEEKYLQSVLNYERPSYVLEEIDPLLNPAILYYIPSDSAEDEDKTISFEESTVQPEISTARIVSSTAYQRPATTTTEILRQTSTSRPPPRYRPPIDPLISYRTSTTLSSAGSRTPRPKTRSRHSQKLREQDSKDFNTPKYKIVSKPNNILPEFVDSYEPQFSDPGLESFDESLSIVAHSAKSRPSKRRRTKIKKHKISKPSISKELPPPQQEVAQVVEIYRLPGQEDSEEFFEQYERDYSFDFDNASGSAPQTRYKPAFVTSSNHDRYRSPVSPNPPHKHYRPPAVTISPYKQAPVYRTSTKSYRAPKSLYKVGSIENTSGEQSSRRDFIQAVPNIYVPQEYNENDIPGVGGTDYPIYHRVPGTRFSCSDQDHPGLYADPETGCQAFYICQTDGREHSFLCPNGTVFNQRFFVCDWWYNFSCDQANDFYSLNAFLYEFGEDQVKRGISYS